MGQGEENYRSASTQTERRWEEVICTRVIGQKAGSPFLFEALLSGAFLDPVWVELRPICEALEQDEAFMGRQTGRPHSRFPGAHNSSTAFLCMDDAVRHACRYHLQSTTSDTPVEHIMGMYTTAWSRNIIKSLPRSKAIKPMYNTQNSDKNYSDEAYDGARALIYKILEYHHERRRRGGIRSQ